MADAAQDEILKNEHKLAADASRIDKVDDKLTKYEAVFLKI